MFAINEPRFIRQFTEIQLNLFYSRTYCLSGPILDYIWNFQKLLEGKGIRVKSYKIVPKDMCSLFLFYSLLFESRVNVILQGRLCLGCLNLFIKHFYRFVFVFFAPDHTYVHTNFFVCWSVVCITGDRKFMAAVVADISMFLCYTVY